MNVFFFALNTLLGIFIPLAIQLLDRASMTSEERRWVWGYATWGGSLYNFGPLALVAWGYVTRSPRYWLGLLVGVQLAARALIAQAIVNEVVARWVGQRPRDLADARVGFVVAIYVAVGLALLVGAGRSLYETVRGKSARSVG